jgi:hypothetical protein
VSVEIWWTAMQPFQGSICIIACVIPGLPKRNPGLELANAFSVGHRERELSIP